MPFHRHGVNELRFPSRGLIKSRAFHDQPHDSTVDCENMRPFDWVFETGRMRGTQRPGYSKWVSTQVSGANPVVGMGHITTSDVAVPSSTAIVNRDITFLAVADGDILRENAGSWASPTGGVNALDANAPVVYMAPLFGVMYFADGTNDEQYTVSTDTVAAWTPTAGSLPANGAHRCRLITMWRSRIVMSGLNGDRHNWFMSKVGDANDWDYSPATPTAIQAVAGNNSVAGLVGDIINAIIPYNDDILIFLCDHSVWQMTNDPADGGRIDRISDVTGGAFGTAWCKDPSGTVYFFGSRGGVFSMRPGEVPERMTSDTIEEELQSVDLSDHTVQMEWEDDEQGVYLAIIPLDTTVATRHYFWDFRTQSWWPDRFIDKNHNPRFLHTFDGDDPADRVFLMGCNDGYVRKRDVTSKVDDDKRIDSYIWLGPIRMSDARTLILHDMQVVLGQGSSDVSYRIYAGPSEEAAQKSDYVTTGYFTEGRNRNRRHRVRGQTLYIELRNNTYDEAWALESFHFQFNSTTGAGRRIFHNL